MSSDVASGTRVVSGLSRTGTFAFPYLLLPSFWAARNRMQRRERGDSLRGLLFGGVGLVVIGALFWGAYWLTTQLAAYEEFGDYLLRLGLSWLFLSFLAFLAFSGIVTALSSFFLSDDLRLLMTSPIAARRLFAARFTRTLASASWMVIIFITPVLAGIGVGRCAPWAFYATAVATVVPFAMIPVALGSACTLCVVNVFPARRARDLLMLMGLVFAAGIVLLLRFIQPERLLRVESLPDITDFFATLQSPITPLLPSFWAGEALFASIQGSVDWLHQGALWTTAGAFTVLLAGAHERWHFTGYSRSQEAPKTRFAHFRALDAIASALPLSAVRRQLLVKDVKVFLRDVSQWVQLLPLFALVLLYLYNFQVLDLERVAFIGGFIKNIYAFVNLGMAGFVMATVAVRFVFPAVSAEGSAFWIIRTSPISMHDFLWSKFWTALVPVLLFTEVLTIAANQLLGVDPFLKVVAAGAIIVMTFALVGLATGLGARYPRFGADATQAAGSYGGVMFMILAVLLIIVVIALIGWPSSMYMMSKTGLMRFRLTPGHYAMIAACFTAVVAICGATWWLAMRSGVRALDAMRD
jgi:ABC-2 type transport system permease protein